MSSKIEETKNKGLSIFRVMAGVKNGGFMGTFTEIEWNKDKNALVWKFMRILLFVFVYNAVI